MIDFSKIKKFDKRFKFIDEVLYKKCTECKLFIEHSKFTKEKNTSDKKTPNCNDCRKLKLNNEKQREYYQKGYKTKKADYFQVNKEKIYKQRKDKRKTCQMSNLLLRVRKFVRKTRLKQKTRKGNTTIKVLGCSKEELLLHLIYTFENNYGIKYSEVYFNDLHIDHIIPLSSGQNEDAMLKLNHYSNLQFLHKDHNMEKKTSVNYKIPPYPLKKSKT